MRLPMRGSESSKDGYADPICSARRDRYTSLQAKEYEVRVGLAICTVDRPIEAGRTQQTLQSLSARRVVGTHTDVVATC